MLSFNPKFYINILMCVYVSNFNNMSIINNYIKNNIKQIILTECYFI